MNGYSFVLAVIRREQDEEYIDFFRQNGVAEVFSTLCEGAAMKNTLDMLGLERKDKLVLCCVIPSGMTESIIKHLRRELHIDAPNNGLALFINLESIGGASALRHLCSEEAIMGDRVINMKEAQYSLIVAIAEKGHTGSIMDAARDAGARGGTIIRAKGTGSEGSTKFFGVSIAIDKELLYIVTESSQREAIMGSIMQKAGINSPAHTVTFSLPVDSIAGISFMEEE